MFLSFLTVILLCFMIIRHCIDCSGTEIFVSKGRFNFPRLWSWGGQGKAPWAGVLAWNEVVFYG